MKTDLPERLIPRDVTTRWNSTYDMLAFVLEYCVAVDSFTAKRKNDSRDLELRKEEWVVVKQLSKVLMVRGCTNHGWLNKHFLVSVINLILSGLETRNSFLFTRNTKSRPCNPSHG